MRRGMPQTVKKLEYLDKASREHPEYREILAVFHGLFSFIQGREGDTGITFEVPVHLRKERIQEGFPLIARESISVDREKTVSFLSGVVDVMKEVGREGKEDLGRIDRCLRESGMDLPGLFAACLARDRGIIDEAARAVSVPPPLLAFLVEVPVKTALEEFAESVDPSEIEGWEEGYCPVCGGRAGMDELVGEEGRRLLSCSACFFRWPFQRLKCPYCGNEDPDTLSYFTAGDEPTRVGVCRKCSRYIKTRDSRKGNADVPLEVEDLTTLHLDLLAGKEGFERGK